MMRPESHSAYLMKAVQLSSSKTLKRQTVFVHLVNEILPIVCKMSKNSYIFCTLNVRICFIVVVCKYNDSPEEYANILGDSYKQLMNALSTGCEQ